MVIVAIIMVKPTICQLCSPIYVRKKGIFGNTRNMESLGNNFNSDHFKSCGYFNLLQYALLLTSVYTRNNLRVKLGNNN